MANPSPLLSDAKFMPVFLSVFLVLSVRQLEIFGPALDIDFPDEQLQEYIAEAKEYKAKKFLQLLVELRAAKWRYLSLPIAVPNTQ
jgi:hypothetical protein